MGLFGKKEQMFDVKVFTDVERMAIVRVISDVSQDVRNNKANEEMLNSNQLFNLNNSQGGQVSRDCLLRINTFLGLYQFGIDNHDFSVQQSGRLKDDIISASRKITDILTKKSL